MPEKINITKNLILYIAQSIREMEGVLGVTRLVKLLYLIDIEYFRRHKQQLTELDWIFYKHGPYAFEVESVLGSLALRLSETDIKIGGGRTFRQLQSHGADVGINAFGGRKAQIVTDLVVRTWATEDLNKLLSYVYFHTEPMANPELGKPLMFSLITSAPAVRPLDGTSLLLSEGEAKAARSRLKALRELNEARLEKSQEQWGRIRRPNDPIETRALQDLHMEEPPVRNRGFPIEVDVDGKPSDARSR